MTEGGWELLPHFLLRSTGFPFDWLERLALPDSVACIEALLDAEAELERAADDIHRLLERRADGDGPGRRDRDERAARRGRRAALRTAIRHRRPIPPDGAQGPPASGLGAAIERWNRTVARHDDLAAEARRVFDTELSARRVALREVVAHPGIREAMWLSSPQMVEHGLDPYLEGRYASRPSEARRVERQLVSYLQRFCAKNDTAGVFGPINYGDFEGRPGPAPGPPGARAVRHREAFVAFWAVKALAAAITADPAVRPALRPRRSPAHRFDLGSRTAGVPSRPARALTERAALVLAVADGERTVAEIASGLRLPVEVVLEEVDRLARAGLVSSGLNVPVGELHPLRWLRAWVRCLPENEGTRSRWLDRLDALLDLERRFAEARLEEKRQMLRRLEEDFASLTGQGPRRAAGQLYADRLLVYEESLGGLSPLRFGPDCHAALLEALRPVLDRYAGHAVELQRQIRAFGAALIREAGGEMPLVAFLERVSEGDGFVPAPTAWQRAIRAQLGDGDMDELVLDPSALPQLDPEAARSEVLMASPDVLLLARDEAAVRSGRFDVVLGECHDTLLLYGWALCFHPDRRRVEAATEEAQARAAAGRTLANVLTSKRVKILPFEYPGPTIEVAAASSKPAADRIPLSSVSVGLDGGEPVLRVQGRPPMLLYNGELASLAHRVLSLPRVAPPEPWDEGGHTPRVRIGRTVIQRARWRVTLQDLWPGAYQGDSFELLFDYRRACRRLGLPRYVFARIEGERKPVLVDGHGYLLLLVLRSLLARGGRAVLSEMLPGPDDLWLRGPEGRYTCELRLGAYHVPEEPTPADLAAAVARGDRR